MRQLGAPKDPQDRIDTVRGMFHCRGAIATKLSGTRGPSAWVWLKLASPVLAESAGLSLPPGELGRAGEQLVAEHMRKVSGHEFLFISEYPVSVRPFYHMRCEDDPTSTKSYDLLWNGLEITTGAQREHRYDILVAQSLEKGLSPDSIADYLGFFKFGCPPHGGFGFGLARLTMTLLGIQNIRDVAFVARDPDRLRP